MPSYVSFIFTPLATAAFVYVSVRIFAYFRGVPALDSRLRRWLELGGDSAPASRPLVAPGLWILVGILALTEYTVVTDLARAFADADAARIALSVLHFVIAAGWLAYLSGKWAGSTS
jgi:uncharacterized membrane protein